MIRVAAVLAAVPTLDWLADERGWWRALAGALLAGAGALVLTGEARRERAL